MSATIITALLRRAGELEAEAGELEARAKAVLDSGVAGPMVHGQAEEDECLAFLKRSLAAEFRNLAAEAGLFRRVEHGRGRAPDQSAYHAEDAVSLRSDDSRFGDTMDAKALNEEVLTDKGRMFLYLQDPEYHAKVTIARKLLDAVGGQAIDGDVGLPFLFAALRDRLCGKEAEDAARRLNDVREAIRAAEAGTTLYPMPYQHEDPRHWGLGDGWR